MTFTDEDKQQLQEIGISEEEVLKQIDHFKNGFPYVNLVRAATIDDGIVKLEPQKLSYYAQFYEEKTCTPIKFVPASGAASRMFKDLFAYHEKPESAPEMDKMLDDYKKFAFAEDIEKANANANKKELADFILNEKGLNYGHLPKGLIKFHRYENDARTALEEHLVEGAKYAKDKDGVVRIHFTVSPEHQQAIEALIDNKKPHYEAEYGIRFDISYSIQKRSTNTIAVDLNNEPFREEDGSLLFRPAGHGAILANLDALDGDVIFIKNIDNVVPDRLKSTTYEYKEALAGYLLWLQEQLFGFLETLKSNTAVREDIDSFINMYYGVDCSAMSNDEVEAFLNRPMRVCGMVKNEGEPGGGPFWVKDEHDRVSLQIIETSQIDMSNEQQASIVQEATHFNPVDLVCSTKDFEGNKFNLSDFTDPKTGFISKKSKDGKELKAQELPGLWNGSMADWLTVFVEVPVITFNPVKTIKDLLRPEHQ